MEIMIIIMGLFFDASIQHLILGAPVPYAGSIEGTNPSKIDFWCCECRFSFNIWVQTTDLLCLILVLHLSSEMFAHL